MVSWDILVPGGSALKAITGFIFGGGLFDLIKNMSGGIFGFISYLLNPRGLLFDALKQGGKIVKTIFDFAINAIGSAEKFIKDFIGGVFSRFVENFPTIKIPEGWGVQTTLGKLLGWIPFQTIHGGRKTDSIPRPGSCLFLNWSTILRRTYGQINVPRIIL